MSWHMERHSQDRELISKYFDAHEFERELDSLPGIYGEPEGGLLLAYCDEVAAGCVAFKRLDERRCEMKRMFVDSKFQGKGVGKALGAEIVEKAGKAGYSTMLLDTSINQTEAMALYRSMGFTDADPYYDVPKELQGWLVFMLMDLR